MSTITSTCDNAHPVRSGPTTTSTRSTVAVASAGPLLVLFAFTVPLTTLTSTAQGLGAGAGIQAWIMSGMSVGAAAGLLTGGAIGDHYGRRLTFVFGCALLASTSLLAAFAPNSVTFVIARVLQGFGGAAILACSLGIIGRLYPAGLERVRSTGIW